MDFLITSYLQGHFILPPSSCRSGCEREPWPLDLAVPAVSGITKGWEGLFWLKALFPVCKWHLVYRRLCFIWVFPNLLATEFSEPPGNSLLIVSPSHHLLTCYGTVVPQWLCDPTPSMSHLGTSHVEQEPRQLEKRSQLQVSVQGPKFPPQPSEVLCSGGVSRVHTHQSVCFPWTVLCDSPIPSLLPIFLDLQTCLKPFCFRRSSLLTPFPSGVFLQHRFCSSSSHPE